MKKIIMLFGVIAMVLTSCESDTSSDVSGVTNYAVFDFEQVVAVPLGGSYTPTATATENGAEIPVTISGDGDVDTSTVGVYFVDYAATNSDGFDAVVTQAVVVHDPNIIGTDVSGEIRDKNTNSRTATISLVPGTTSIFYVTDFAYAGAFPMYFQMNGDTISEIPQVYPLGVTNVDLGYDPDAGTNGEFTVVVYPDEFAYTFEYQP